MLEWFLCLTSLTYGAWLADGVRKTYERRMFKVKAYKEVKEYVQTHRNHQI